MNFQTKSLVSAGLIIGSILVGYFVLLPRWKEYKNVNTQISAEQEKNDALVTAQKQLNQFLEDYKQHQSEAARINDALPVNSKEMQNVLKSLDDMARSSGVALGELGNNETGKTATLGAAPNTIQTLNIDLKVTGSFASFSDFISRLENSLRIMDMRSVSIQASSDQGNANDNTFQIKFTTYYQN